MRQSYLDTAPMEGILIKYSEDIYFSQKKIKQLTEKNKNLEIEILKRLSLAAKFKDTDTGFHVLRVGLTAQLIAERYGMNKEFTLNIYHAAQMHDVGKIAIVDSVLKKTEHFTLEDRIEMEFHTVAGYNILTGSGISLLDFAAEIALCHHERFDGKGYPQKLKGTEIPISARIVALADFFDALTMDRVYRKAMSDQDAFNLITAGKGSHFDKDVVEAFLGVSGDIIKIRNDFNQQ
ncbi:MAG: hypothetical protein RI893_621 [Pseudomonadota bacterium]|jgi:putative two-component system response regulator